MTVQEKLQKLDEMYAEGNLAQAEKQLKNWIGDADIEFEKGAKLTFYNELIGLYRTTGRAKQGAELAEEAMALIEELGAAGTVSHGTTLLNAATVYARAALYDRSLELYAQAADIFAAQGLENSYQMAGLFNNMSRVYGEKGDDEKALSFLEEALKIISAQEDCEEEQATTWVNISYALMKLGRLEEADEYIRKAIIYYASPAGCRDPHYAAALAASAELETRRGNYEDALESYEKALTETKNHYGYNDYCRLLEQNIATVKEKMEKKS